MNVELEDAYKDMLDDCQDTELRVGNITFYASVVLRQCDPIAYRCGFNDYVDMLITDGLYCETCEELGDDCCVCESCAGCGDTVEDCECKEEKI